MLTLKGKVASAKADKVNDDKAKQKYEGGDIRGYSIFLHIYEVNGKPVYNPEMTNAKHPYLLVDLVGYADDVVLDTEGNITWLNLVHPLPVENWDEDCRLSLSFSPQKSIVVLECSNLYARLVDPEKVKGNKFIPARAGKAVKRSEGRPDRLADIIHRIDNPVILDEYLPTLRVLNNTAPVMISVPKPAQKPKYVYNPLPDSNVNSNGHSGVNNNQRGEA